VPVRFLHVADLHLGMRITQFEESACDRICEARIVALENLRKKAVEHRVDFVLVAGDLFDDHGVSHNISETAFTLFEGKHMPCPVYIIAGNHDPITPGGVWDRDPWLRDQPIKQTHFLRDAVPIQIPNLPVTLFPCSLRARNSLDDPTAWIAQHPRQPGDGTIRIGMAHGSLKILPSLPDDDHLIRSDAADAYGLDYLALGHWHKPLRCKSADGGERTSYSGTHEPMRFPSLGAAASTGWQPYTSGGDPERFADAGCGCAQLVAIEQAGARPQIETVEIGHLRWCTEHRDLSALSIGELFGEFTDRAGRGQTLLRLHLRGVIDPEKYGRIARLREIVERRYYPGSSLIEDQLLMEPSDEQLRAMVGSGVVARVAARLQEEKQSSDPAVREVAALALKELYRIVWEEKPQ
jgi:DNA repair exonuclease SbcCD nuclease subunit